MLSRRRNATKFVELDGLKIVSIKLSEASSPICSSKSNAALWLILVFLTRGAPLQ
jgi:hypothetical protein